MRYLRHHLLTIFQRRVTPQIDDKGHAFINRDDGANKLGVEDGRCRNIENENTRSINTKHKHYQAEKNCLRKNVGRQTFEKLCFLRSQQVDFLHILHTWRIFQYAYKPGSETLKLGL